MLIGFRWATCCVVSYSVPGNNLGECRNENQVHALWSNLGRPVTLLTLNKKFHEMEHLSFSFAYWTNSAPFMEAEGSLPHSQKPAIDPSAQPTAASSETSIPAPSTTTLIIFSYLRKISGDIFPLRAKRCCLSLISHACYMSGLSNPHRILLYHRIWKSVQNMELASSWLHRASIISHFIIQLMHTIV